MKKFINGFVYAGKGVFYCLRNERNMRIHLCFTTYMFGFLGAYDFFSVTRAEYAILLCLCALVMSLEAVNTAIERVVDLATSEIHPLAKAAKDVAAGAVLISAFFSVMAGITILYQPEAFFKMFDYYSEKPEMLVVLAISVIASLIFIFAPKQRGAKK